MLDCSDVESIMETSMSIGFGQILLLVLIVFVIFGAGKLPQVMGDLGRGLRSFKDGMRDEKDEENKKLTDV